MRLISRWYTAKARNNPQGTYGLENDIRFRRQLLQARDIVEGSKGHLESQPFKTRSLLGRAKVDGDLVVGSSGVLDEMSEDSASKVTWSIQTSDEQSAPDNRQNTVDGETAYIPVAPMKRMLGMFCVGQEMREVMAFVLYLLPIVAL